MTDKENISASKGIVLEKESAVLSESAPVRVSTHFFQQQYLFAFATQAEVLQYVRTQTLSEELARLPEIFSAWQNVQPRVGDLIRRAAGIADTSASTTAQFGVLFRANPVTSCPARNRAPVSSSLYKAEDNKD